MRWAHILSFFSSFIVASGLPRACYTSALTTNSSIALRSQAGSVYGFTYYEMMGFTVAADGGYIIQSNSTMDTVGYIYNGTLRQTDNVENAWARDYDSGGNYQFRMSPFLRAAFVYTLGVTTTPLNVTGPFTVCAVGDALVTFYAIWVWRLMNEIDEPLPYLFTFYWSVEYL